MELEQEQAEQSKKPKKSKLEASSSQTKPKKNATPSSLTARKKKGTTSKATIKKERRLVKHSEKQETLLPPSSSDRKTKKRKKRTPEEQAAYQKRKTAYLKEKKKRRRRQKRVKRMYESALLSIGILVVFFLLLKVRIHRVEGQSMNPTLKDKEIVLTEKTKNIQRGELVIFQLKASEPAYVKRVVGMPGDALWLSGNTLFINPYIKFSMAIIPSGDTLPSGTISVELKMEDLKGIQGFSRIPADSYFVLGDNYDNSVDSRNFGFINKEMIDGKVFQ